MSHTLTRHRNLDGAVITSLHVSGTERGEETVSIGLAASKVSTVE